MQAVIRKTRASRSLLINEQPFNNRGYQQYHRHRIRFTLNQLLAARSRRIVEVGGHPWAMTAAIVDHPKLQLLATISAEEVLTWPDEIAVQRRIYSIRTFRGKQASFPNYSVNIERSLCSIQETPDTVLACEILEHLLRAPHIMLLNINKWLPMGGKLLITTPNGAQFFNPLRRHTLTPHYRAHVYQRHSFLYTLPYLRDVLELCGFEISESVYCNMYKAYGLARVYRLLSWLPLPYFQQKFRDTIYVRAHKSQDVLELPRRPAFYEPSPDWEYIKHGS